MSFNITKINYPRTLMFGETYDFSKITVETDSGLTIESIDATWLNHQPPFSEMGYYPIEITATATNGETATTTANVFVFEKPHDGFGKFMIFTYQNITRLLSYDCNNNPEHNKLYKGTSGSSLNDMTSQNGYLGQQGYDFNESTKQWVFNKKYTGYHDRVMRASFYVHDILYSNADIYENDKTTLFRSADPYKTNLPQWDRNVVVRTEVGDYPNPIDYDNTIEAYYIYQCAYNSGSKRTIAVCFRNLSEPVLDLRLTPVSSKQPRFEHGDSTIEMRVIELYSSGWGSMIAWKKQTYAFTTSSLLQDNTLRYITFMNSLQEVHNINFSMVDANGNYRRSFVMPPKPEAPDAKDARYRVKEDDGSYTTLHLETNRDMVIGLNDKLSEIDTLIENQYNKAQTMALFNEVDEEIQAMEAIAEGLNQRLEMAESDIQSFTTALEQEVSRATQEEARLQEQLNGLDFDLDVVNHPESGILAQSKDYTDELVKGLTDGAIKDLEGALAGNVADLTNRFEALNQTVASNKAEAEVKLSQLDGRLTNTESRVEVLEGQIVELSEEDARLAVEIERLNTHLANKGSDTLVFETREEFEQASLSPKIGDLVYILEEKRAYIFTQDNGFVVFDEITNHLDLVSYVKKDEVATLFEGVASRLTTEVERAQLAEQQLSHQLADLSDVVGTHSAAISGLETLTQAQGVELDDLESSRYTQDDIDRLIEEAIELQAPHLGDEAPALEGLKEGHVWLDTTIE